MEWELCGCEPLPAGDLAGSELLRAGLGDGAPFCSGGTLSHDPASGRRGLCRPQSEAEEGGAAWSAGRWMEQRPGRAERLGRAERPGRLGGGGGGKGERLGRPAGRRRGERAGGLAGGQGARRFASDPLVT